MSTIYNGNPANGAQTPAIQIQRPSDGDAANVESVNTALQKLADYVAWIQNFLGFAAGGYVMGGSDGDNIVGVTGAGSSGAAPGGVGVTGLGGGPNGIGVNGYGFGSGAGVKGGSQNGVGVMAVGNASSAALQLEPQAAPSNLADGMIWVETGTNTLKVRINGVTRTVNLT